MTGLALMLTGEIRTRFIGARCGTGRLPSRHIYRLKIFSHLGDLNWVKTIQRSVYGSDTTDYLAPVLTRRKYGKECVF